CFSAVHNYYLSSFGLRLSLRNVFNCARNQITELARGAAAQALGPGSVKLRPFGWRNRSVFDNLKAGRPVTRDQSCLQKFERKRAESESLDLRAIAFGIESDDHFQPGVGSADAAQIAQHHRIDSRHCAQQADPREMRT